MLRTEVAMALADKSSNLSALTKEWRQFLFPGADDITTADAYAQTFTYALLIARFEGAQLVTHDDAGDHALIDNAVKALQHEHGVLSEALRLLSDPKVFDEVATSATTLLRMIGAIDPKKIVKKDDDNPWLYFYEDFLAAYDPELRKKVGAYYTPPQVVDAQVHLVEDLLISRLGAEAGFADPTVTTLDPAVGTGTYPLQVLESIVESTPSHAKASLPERLRQGAKHIFGFEYLIGPYAVAHLRLSRFLADHGLEGDDAVAHNVLLANTLESHETSVGQLSFTFKEISSERERAQKVKADSRVVVCIGNPPYRRGTKTDLTTGESLGGWVTMSHPPSSAKVRDPATGRMVKDKGETGIIEDFFRPAREAGNGGDLKNAYNAYVYFWRWGLWKVFEQEIAGEAASSGVISFITASSYLRGPGFVGMREHMRRLLDELWIIDLGGDNKGGRKSENVFNIETPVAIAIGVRIGSGNHDVPAKVRYVDLSDHSAADKLSILGALETFEDSVLDWQDCLDGWQEPFLPAKNKTYLTWPLLTDLFPWQAGGSQIKRTWPIGETPEVLEQRWATLVAQEAARKGETAAQAFQRRLVRQRKQFKESRDRKVDQQYQALVGETRDPSISSLPPGTPAPTISRYAYRSLDRQWVIADSRLGDYMRPSLWRAHGPTQVYMTSLLTKVIGEGPAALAAADVPDMDHFSNRGARDVIPLWTDTEGTKANVTAGVLDSLLMTLGTPVSAEALFAYAYGLLATPAYAERFWEELTIPGQRVPITTDQELFLEVAAFGRELLFLHTYGERFGTPGQKLVVGSATYTSPISASTYPESIVYDPDTLTIAIGGVGRFENVAPEVWDYSISGFQVVKSWLAYRKFKRAGKSGASPLDEIRPQTWPDLDGSQLLSLLWVVERTIALHPQGSELLERVMKSNHVVATELPFPTEAERGPLGDVEDGLDE
jgi:predicted helicase